MGVFLISPLKKGGKMKNFKKILSFVLIFALSFSFVNFDTSFAADGNHVGFIKDDYSGEEISEESYTALETMTVGDTNNVEAAVVASYGYEVTEDDGWGDESPVYYGFEGASSDPSIVEVSKSSLKKFTFTAKGEGTATITILSTDAEANATPKEFDVTVSAASGPVPSRVEITNPEPHEMETNSTYQITAKIYDQDENEMTDVELEYVPNSEYFATVDENGLVTSKDSEATLNVEVKVKDTEIKDTISIQIKKPEDPPVESNFIFDASTGTINGYVDKEGPVDLVIPEEIDGVAVKAIGDNAFKYSSFSPNINTPLESVELPEGIETIGKSAFQGNNIKSVVLPSTVTSLDNRSFSFNSELTSFDFNGVTITEIPKELFYKCDKLADVEIPSTVTKIGERGFADTILSDVTIPDAVTDIGSGSFQLNLIEEITLPASIAKFNEKDNGKQGGGVFFRNFNSEDKEKENLRLTKVFSDSDVVTNMGARGIVNPASVTLKFQDTEGTEIKESRTFVGYEYKKLVEEPHPTFPSLTVTTVGDGDGHEITDYMAPSTNYKLYTKFFEEISSNYFVKGQEKTFEADDIPGYEKPDSQTVNLEVGENEIVFTYADSSKFDLTLNGEGLTSEPSDPQIGSGAEVVVTVTEPADKIVDTFTVNGEDKKQDLVKNGDVYNYTFVIETNTTIEVTYKDVEDVILINELENVEVKGTTKELDSSWALRAEVVDKDFLGYVSETYNIELLEGEVAVQPKGTVQVSIKIPTKFSSSEYDKLKVYFNESEDNLVEVDSNINLELGNIEFETDHLSNWAIARAGVNNKDEAYQVLQDKYKSYDSKDYTPEEWNNLKDAYVAGKQAIYNAENLPEIEAALEEAIAAMEAVPVAGVANAIDGWGSDSLFDAGNQVGTVNVHIENVKYDGAPESLKGELVHKENYPIGENDTVMTVILRALSDEGFTWNNNTNDFSINFISSISKGNDTLSGGESGMMSGWMGTLNDWFTNEGFDAFSVENGKLSGGDVINVFYSLNGGADYGGTWENKNTKLKELNVLSGEVLSPEFDSDTFEYTISIDSDIAELNLNPVAENKNFLVKTFLNEKVTTNDEGPSFYKRGEVIPVVAGDVVWVGCGEYEWPSMNSFGTEPGDYSGTWYKINIVAKPKNNGIYAYLPAPGQFVNKGVNTGGIPSAYLSDLSGTKDFINNSPTMSTLGAFGGYLVLDFGQPEKDEVGNIVGGIFNDPTNANGMDFIVYGNAFAGWGEPGGIQVSENGETWYDLAGSAYYGGYSTTDAKLKYTNPAPADDELAFGEIGTSGNDVPFTGTVSGAVKFNNYHQHSYFPLYNNYFVEHLVGIGALDKSSVLPFATYNKDVVNGSTLELSGVLINNFDGQDVDRYRFGYFDFHSNGNGDKSNAVNPYIATKQSQGGDPMDLSWAVDSEGNPVQLDSARYVRLYTAVSKDAPPFGEVSAEVSGVYNTANDGSGEEAVAPTVEIVEGDVTTPVSIERMTTVEHNLTDMSAETVQVKVTTDAENIFVNGTKIESGATVEVPATGKFRVITQSSDGPAFIGVVDLVTPEVSIVGAEEIEDITVEYETELTEVGLPEKIKLNADDESQVEVDVTWEGEYDPTISGTYTLTANYEMPEGYGGEKPVVTVNVIVKKAFIRISGKDRFETAVNTSKMAFESSKDVIIVNGYNYPDGLSAGVLASEIHAPILITGKYSLPEVISEEITRLGVENVYIVGGKGVVTERVKDSIASISGVENITRISGKDRYETSVEVAKTIEKIREKAGKKVNNIVVAYGHGYADSVSSTPLAVEKGAPIILVRKNSLPNSVSEYLSSHSDFNEIVISGGSGVVSTDVENLLSQHSNKVTRYGGVNRYDTARKLASALTGEYKNVIVAKGYGFIDALTAINIIADSRYGGPVLLTTTNSLSVETREYLESNKDSIHRSIIVGGTGVVSEAVHTAIKMILK